MKRTILLSLFLGIVLTYFSYGQTKELDLKEIQRFATSTDYDDLLERYIDNDVTLTIDDYRNLYYGQAYQSDFSAYKNSDKETKLWNYLQNKTSPVNYDTVLNYAAEILEESPFNILVLTITMDAYKKLGDEEKSHIYSVKFQRILLTIASSGDGLKAKSAMVVTCIHDEYAMLGMLGLESKMQELVNIGGKYYDVLTVKKNQQKIKKVYFDINLFYGKM